MQQHAAHALLQEGDFFEQRLVLVAFCVGFFRRLGFFGVFGKAQLDQPVLHVRRQHIMTALEQQNAVLGVDIHRQFLADGNGAGLQLVRKELSGMAHR
jgi:hypothetical protein